MQCSELVDLSSPVLLESVANQLSLAYGAAELPRQLKGPHRAHAQAHTCADNLPHREHHVAIVCCGLLQCESSVCVEDRAIVDAALL